MARPGSGARRWVPVSTPRIGAEDIRLVTRSLREGWLSSRGPYVEQFERRFARWVGGRFGISTSSGTTALHLALAALGVGPGDRVILPDFTMVACVDAVLYTGATPVFADVDPDYWTLSAELAAPLVTGVTRAIMPVHLYGHPADMDPLLRLSRERSLDVIEDAAEAHGTLYRGHRVGALGSAGCFSFYSNKLLSTGEGGMLVSRDPRVAARAYSLRDLAFAHRERDYHHSTVGFNYRLTSLQSALGLGQLGRIEEHIRHRRACARVYHDVLEGVRGLTLPPEAPWARSVYWMYTVRVRRGPRVRRAVMRALARRGVESRVGFWPLHRQPFCRKFVPRSARFPVSDALGRETLSLPSGNGTRTEDVEYAAQALRDILRA
jgi:perosamine synthetase